MLQLSDFLGIFTREHVLVKGKRMSSPHVALLMDMFSVDKSYSVALKKAIGPQHIALVDWAIQDLSSKVNGERMILILKRYYGIEYDKASLAQIGRELSRPVTAPRVRVVKERALQSICINPKLQSVAAKLKECGVDSRAVNKNLSMPSVELMQSLQSLVDANMRFEGTFLLDHFPGCTANNPCPTCQAKVALEQHNLLDVMLEIASQWQQGPSNDWRSVPVSALKFSNRLNNTFREEGLKTLGQLVKTTSATLLLFPYFGRKSLSEVRGRLAELGLSLADEEVH